MNKVKVLITMPKRTYTRISKPNDIKELKSFAEVIMNIFDKKPSEDKLVELISEVDGCITSWGSPKITKRVVKSAKKLKIIGHAAGSIKPYICEEVFIKGITVVHAAPIIAKPVAEFTLALMLNCLRAIPQHFIALKFKKNWNFRERKEKYTRDLKGKTIGIVGFGYVARELVKLLEPFEVRILVYDPYVEHDKLKKYNAKKVSLEELLSNSDIVTIHAALTEETRHMIGERELKLLKPHAFIINTARGAIIDEKALIKALKEKWIAGVALDVYEREPLPEDSPLYELDNVILTPHIAGASGERISTLLSTIIEEFKLFFEGKEPRYKIRYERLKIMA